MAENKTKPTNVRVSDFLNGVENPTRRADAKKVASIMRRITGKRAAMWGPSMVGYGKYHYHYQSGRKGEWMLTGFSPRKQALTIYIMPGFSRFRDLMAKLGKYKTGKSCLYIRRLADVDETVLERLIGESVSYMRAQYETG